MKKLNARATVFISAVALIFAILGFMLLNPSVAWFADNGDVSANGFTINIDDGSMVTATLKSYPIKEIDVNTDTYTVYREGGEHYTLPINDEHSISYSEYKKALAVIITLTSEEVSTVRIVLNATASVETLVGNANYLSNCIQVSTATLNGDQAQKSGFTETFVTVADGVSKKYAIDFGEFELQNGTSEICVILEYSGALLKHIGDGVIQSGSSSKLIEYSNDIEFHVYPQILH